MFTSVQYGEGPGDFAVPGYGHIGRGTLSAEPACVLEKAYGVHMEEEAPGIYYIKGLLFPLQILVIRELSKEDNIWLSRLRSGLKPDEDIEVLMKEYKGKEQNPLYETAMDLILRANWETCQEVEKMCDALRELFADELEERETIGLEKGLEQGKMAKLITQVMRKREKDSRPPGLLRI